MEKLYIAVLYIFFGLLIFIPQSSEAQDAPAAPPPAQTPDVIQPPPDFPDYIVTPREDLNNFDLSTMSESDDIDYRDGVGTLGTTEKRGSNLDVNAELKRKKMEREKARQKAEEEKQKENNSGAQESSKAVSSPPSGPNNNDGFTPGVKRGLFMWKDENGVLHATNDLGHVPIEYQMQALEKSEGSMEIKKGDNN